MPFKLLRIRITRYFSLIAPALALSCVTGLASGQTNHIISWQSPASDTDRTIVVGDTVTWVWNDLLLHTVTSTTALFDSGLLSGLGTEYQRVFDSEGGFGYLCQVHGAANMGGTITVNEPLPVELTRFDALVDGSDVILTWTTASETDNAGFYVQLAFERGWNDMAFIEGQGASLEVVTYSHRFSGLKPGAHHFRLKQIDFDGSTEFSHVVEAIVEVPGTHVISHAYPNPIGSESQFTSRTQVSVATPQHVQVLVHATDGRLVDEVFSGMMDGGGTRDIAIDASAWPSGTYVVTFRGERFEDTRMVTVLK